MSVLATISVLCFNKMDITKRFLQMLEATIPKDVEVIITNNGSTDDTEGVVYKSGIENKVYMLHGYNMGFPAGHNEALKIAKGTYFAVINNDLMFREGHWLEKLIAPLADDPSIAIVGLQGEFSTLRADGMASVSDKLDYIDGACMVGRTELFRKHGLFSPSLKMFFFEDSDMSLRYRQMGYKIATVSISHDHMRSTTLRTLEEDYRRKVIKRNGEIFRTRWGGYLKNKMFNNNLLVRMFSHGGGDIICMTPILESLREDHPTAVIELETSWPDVFENNPYIDSVHGVRRSYQKAYDRMIDFNLNYASYNLIVDEAAKVAGTTPKGRNPQLFLTKMELDEGRRLSGKSKAKPDQLVVGCNFQMTRFKWQGRNWNFQEATRLAKMMREAGFIVVELGKDVPYTGEASINLIDKTTLRQLFSVIANVDLFVGMDSMCFHIAQAFSKPSYIIFGATEPTARVTDFTATCPIRLELPCIGCYQKKGKSTYNHCLLGTEACMYDLKAETVFDYIAGETNSYLSNVEYLQNFLRQERI